MFNVQCSCAPLHAPSSGGRRSEVNVDSGVAPRLHHPPGFVPLRLSRGPPIGSAHCSMFSVQCSCAPRSYCRTRRSSCRYITLPRSNMTLPHSNFTLPCGNMTLPRSNFTLPRSNFTLPRSNFTLPCGNMTSSPSEMTSYSCLMASSFRFLTTLLRPLIMRIP